MNKRFLTLLLAAVFALSLFSGCGTERDLPGSETVDQPDVVTPTAPVRMVYLGETLYVDAGPAPTDEPRCGVMDGEIASTVASGEVPMEDGQSNFGTGYAYQFWGRDSVDVGIDGTLYRFNKDFGAEPLAVDAEHFAAVTAGELLDGTENLCYSPVSLYLALAMAATGAAGETQRQMYALLGAQDTETLAADCAELLRVTEKDEENSRLLLANSVWTRKDVKPLKDYEQRLKTSFGAEAFAVDFGDPAVNDKMTRWVAENTKNLLKPEFDHDANTVEVLLNTLYYKNAWLEPFFESATKADTFTTAAGETVTADFMHAETVSEAWWNQDYARAVLRFADNGEMVFVLPNEGTSLEDLLEIYDVDTLLDSPYGWEESVQASSVHWAVPKFKVGMEMDLIPMLKKLGVTDAFDGGLADFRSASDTPCAIGAVRQGTYLTLDETGVEAAAFTEIAKDECAMMTDMVLLMELDRPFLYGIRDENGTLLFVGVCADPTAEN